MLVAVYVFPLHTESEDDLFFPRLWLLLILQTHLSGSSRGLLGRREAGSSTLGLWILPLMQQ